MSFGKMVLAVIAGTLATAGIVFAIVMGVVYFETQKLNEEVAKMGLNSNLPSTETTPPECVKNPDDVFCQLALAKQKVQKLQETNK
jgi:hypothetical protein